MWSYRGVENEPCRADRPRRRFERTSRERRMQCSSLHSRRMPVAPQQRYQSHGDSEPHDACRIHRTPPPSPSTSTPQEQLRHNHAQAITATRSRCLSHEKNTITRTLHAHQHKNSASTAPQAHHHKWRRWGGHRDRGRAREATVWVEGCLRRGGNANKGDGRHLLGMLRVRRRVGPCEEPAAAHVQSTSLLRKVRLGGWCTRGLEGHWAPYDATSNLHPDAPPLAPAPRRTTSRSEGWLTPKTYLLSRGRRSPSDATSSCSVHDFFNQIPLTL